MACPAKSCLTPWVAKNRASGFGILVFNILAFLCAQWVMLYVLFFMKVWDLRCEGGETKRAAVVCVCQTSIGSRFFSLLPGLLLYLSTVVPNLLHRYYDLLGCATLPTVSSDSRDQPVFLWNTLALLCMYLSTEIPGETKMFMGNSIPLLIITVMRLLHRSVSHTAYHNGTNMLQTASATAYPSTRRALYLCASLHCAPSNNSCAVGMHSLCQYLCILDRAHATELN